MTIKELKQILDSYPEDSLVMYRHNEHSRIDVDIVSYKEETTLSGQQIKCITLEASYEED